MLEPTTFLGASAWKLQNDVLTAIVLPEHGGKVASLVYRPQNWELLFQNSKGGFREASRGDDFSDYEACGFDDAFPTVDACEVQLGGRTVQYPDHGELWSAAFTAEACGETLCLRWQSPELGYTYEKQLRLVEDRLVCTYRIHNPGTEPLPALWVCHCLVHCEPDMRILMPLEVTQVENTFTSDWLGQAEATLSYPKAQGPRGALDLQTMPTDGALKYYAASAVKEGCCRYEYPVSHMAAQLEYDSAMLPYLGFWATGGGYRSDVNCALEPANGYYDNIDNARRHNACPVLNPEETWNFTLSIQLSPMA